jgi:hypothetical protein
LSLDRAEALEFFGSDRHLATKTDTTSGALDERHTVRVEGLVDRGSAGLSTSDRNTTRRRSRFVCYLPLATFADGFDDGSLHSELDPIERKEPDNVLRRKKESND